MKKTVQKNEDTGSVNKRKDSIVYLQKTILELEKEISKLHDKCVKKDVQLITQRHRMLALEKVLEKESIPTTIEDIISGIKD